MNDERTPTLNHFGVYGYTPEYWALPAERRAAAYADLVYALEDVATVHPYQLTPLESAADFMLWTVVGATEPIEPRRFFEGLARSLSPFRRYVEPRDSLWGFTRPSQYSRAKSAQEIDPLGAGRAPYLVVYPFTKTVDWYLLGGETRQGMMNEHIRIGKQYREISQLLLYSVGLQDQEFVVVYETDDLMLFSSLVKELRDTQARRYTSRDTPVHTGLLSPPDAAESVWAGS
ncbi:MAG: chlorite dismutase family protein [Gemmatimonadota bacterium]